MKKVDKALLKEAANLLLFDMSEEQYDTLLKEFAVTLRQMELIRKIPGIDDLEPLVYPFPITSDVMREDVPEEPLPVQDVLKNAGAKEAGQISLPRVIEK